MSFDAIVIGAGAAGLFCACTAGQRGRRVLVLEHNDRIGKKILISGGGRCNFTNLSAMPENYVSQNPHFCKSALARFTPAEFVKRVEKHGIKYHEKTAGQLFCTRSSKDMISLLEEECRKADVSIQTSCSIKSVEYSNGFTAKTSHGEFRSAACVIATGGLSYQNLGATGLGLHIARQFGHTIVDPAPALVPFVLRSDDREWLCELAGISFEANVQSQKKSFTGSVLVTHRGLSGPAILQISNYWNPGEELQINFLPGQNAAALLLDHKSKHPNALVKTILSRYLPERLSQELTAQFGAIKPFKQMSEKEICSLAQRLTAWTLIPEATEGFEKAEVTRGGVSTDEISSKTFESNRQPRLFFIGEVLDVTGWLGGYNFHWAWASGFAAGSAV